MQDEKKQDEDVNTSDNKLEMSLMIQLLESES